MEGGNTKSAIDIPVNLFIGHNISLFCISARRTNWDEDMYNLLLVKWEANGAPRNTTIVLLIFLNLLYIVAVQMHKYRGVNLPIYMRLHIITSMIISFFPPNSKGAEKDQDIRCIFSNY